MVDASRELDSIGSPERQSHRNFITSNKRCRRGRVRKRTERLIDFDGSSAAPRAAQAIPPLSPAYFLPASSSVLRLFVCLDVAADEIFTRHKRPTPQICPPPVVISDNNFFHSALFCPTLPPFHSPVRFACPSPLFLSLLTLYRSLSLAFFSFACFVAKKCVVGKS